jgi:hypothetical protein
MALLAADLSEAVLSTVNARGLGRSPDNPAKLGGGSFSLPEPEEGHRLISAFLSIRQPALRKAIIEFVAAMSAVVE